jgi:hypothetical protein
MNRLRYRNRDHGVQRTGNRPGCHALAAALLLFYLCASAATAVAQSTIRVPQNQPTIQAAINAAANGDTVLVAPGTYVENINFNGKAITVTSSGGANATVIAASTTGYVVTFSSGEGSSSTLAGFTIRKSGGGGVLIDSSSPVVKNNIIFDNSGCGGPGIGIRAGAPLIQRNIIHGNGPWLCPNDRGGSGIGVGEESSPQILDNVIVGNISSDDGGGITLSATKNVLVRGNIIAGNSGRSAGGISASNVPYPNLYASNYQSFTTIIQNLIIGNSSFEGGGVSWRAPPDTPGPLLVNNTIADNDGPQVALSMFGNNEARLFNNVIVAKPGQTALDCSRLNAPPAAIRFNNVYAPSGTAYRNDCSNVTGTSGNISTDSLFVNSALGNYRVRANSPVIDAGSNFALGPPSLLPTLDKDGNTRINDGDGNGGATIDMGAYEFTPISHPLTLVSSGTDFGTLLLGAAQVSRIVTISNTGPVAVAVTFSAVASNDPGSFAFTTGGPAPCASLTPTLAPGTSCTVLVSFTPTHAGAKKAMLVVMSDVVGSPAMTPVTANVLQTDTTPDSFTLFAQFDVARGITVVSNSVTVTGIDIPTAISITGGEYSINGGAFTVNPGTIQNGQNVVVRLTSSLRNDEATSATLTVGTVSANFNVATVGPTFSDGNGISATIPFFQSQNAVPGSTVVSSRLILGGVDTPLAISITGGEYSINGGVFTTNAGLIQNGQSVVVRVTAPATFSATNTALLTIGSRFGYFFVSTPNQIAPSPLTYFPLAVGNSRVIRRDGVVGAATTITEARILDSVVAFGMLDAFDGSIAYFSNDGLFGAKLHRTFFPPSDIPGCGMVAETDSYSPPVPIIPPTITIGQTISSGGTLTAEAGACGTISLGYSASSALESIERVSVPAGQFDALKVRWTVSVSGLGSTSSTIWFASGIGEVKTLYSDGSVDELVSTNIIRTKPDEFVFAPLSNVPVTSILISNPVTISGTTAPAAVSITGGAYSINGGPFTSLPGSITNGQSIRVRLTSPAQGATSASAALTIDDVTRTFSVTTGVGVPGAPAAVTVTTGSASITVKFDAPAINGGTAITGYTATCTSSNGGAPGSNTGGAGATSIRVNGLTDGKRYTCTVTASNAAGAGTASAPSNAITPFDITPILNLLLDD